MAVDHGYKFIGKLKSGNRWHLMEGKDFNSKNGFELKNENDNLVSFNGRIILSDY